MQGSRSNIVAVCCPKCGGALHLTDGHTYVCEYCTFVGEKRLTEDTFHKILSAYQEAIQENELKKLANLKRNLYDEVHKENVSNSRVAELCKKILDGYDTEDFYAGFYYATCSSNKSAVSDFLSAIDLSSRTEDDVTDMLDYLLAGLRTEWFAPVVQLIDLFKTVCMDNYNKYSKQYHQRATKVNNGVFEPTLPRDVFVMYSSKDMKAVYDAVAMLENSFTLDCFVAARNLMHGPGAVEMYKDAIHAAIRNCKTVLFVSSQNSRDRSCEAYEELIYIENHFPLMPRAELLLNDYAGLGIERKFKEFFKGREFCTSAEEAGERLSDYCDAIAFGTDVSAVKPATPTPAVQTPTPAPAATSQPAPAAAVTSKPSPTSSKPPVEDAAQRLESARAEEARLAAVKQQAEEVLRMANERHAAELRRAEDARKEDFDIRDGVLVKYKGEAKVVTIPDGVTSIGAEAFRDCTGLTSITILGSVVDIGWAAFSGCSGLTSVTIGGSVTSIDMNAFYGCTGLTSITIPDSVTRIGDWTFQDCTGLTSVTIPDSVTSIGWDAFSGCKSLTSVYYAGTKDEWQNIKLGTNNEPLLSANIHFSGKPASTTEKLSIEDAKAAFNLGRMYECGAGVKASLEDAIKWYTKAAEQGDVAAQCYLAFMYNNGFKVSESAPMAAKWYTKAAEQGHTTAQFNLGVMYESGRGVKQNNANAIKWYTKAAEQGHEKAKKALDRLKGRR